MDNVLHRSRRRYRQLRTLNKVWEYIPMYGPPQATECEKCGNVIAKPKELIRIQKEGESSTVLLSYV